MSTIREFNYDIDLLQSVLWQYDNAEKLLSLLKSKQAWYDKNHTEFWKKWFNNVFYLFNPLPSSDPMAFNRFGAAVWSILLQIPLQIGLPPDPPDTQIFEFDNPENFDNGAFTNGSNTVILDIDDMALILRLRYYQLVTNGALATLPPSEANPMPVMGMSDFVTYVFGLYTKYTGFVYIQDGLDMSITYVFTSELPQDLKFILEHYDILPRPAGVLLKKIVSTDQVFNFGFPENFDNGVFRESKANGI